MKQHGRKRKWVDGMYKERLIERMRESKHERGNQRFKKWQNERELKRESKKNRVREKKKIEND
jgi:hypothetical protein